MPKKRTPTKAARARARQTHAGTRTIVAAIRKVVPFLFVRKKRTRTKSAAAVRGTRKRTAAPRKHAPKKTRRRSAKPKKAASLRSSAALANARTRDVAPKKVRQPTVLPASLGALVLQDDDAAHATQNDAAIAELAQEEGFMQKVRRPAITAAAAPKKITGWRLFKDRFAFSFKRPAASQTPANTLTEDVADDAFLKRIRTEREQRPTAEVALPTLEAFAGEEEAAGEQERDDHLDRHVDQSRSVAPKDAGHLSLNELHKEARDAKEAVAKLREEMKREHEEYAKEHARKKKEGDETAERETAEKKEREKQQEAATREPVVPKRKQQFKKKNGLQRFGAAIGHIGLGKERMLFIQNLGMMLNAGLPLTDALKTLQMETRTKPMKKVIGRIIAAVENGIPLWRAMDAESFFSLHAIALVRIGEEAGNLAQNVEYLAIQEEKDSALKGKVKMAMIYPTIVLTLMFVIVMGLGMFVLPQLISVLYSLNVPLPFITRMVILFTNGFTDYGAVVVPSIIGGFIGFLVLAKFTRFKVVTQWAMFRVPGIGRLAREATIARFGVILGGLLRAGVPVMDAMASLVEVTPIISYRTLYQRMLDHIAIGDSFAKCFSGIKSSHKLIPPSVQQLVVTGEKSGSLADIMLKISDIYGKKAEETAQKLPVVLEPMLLLFIGGLVGTIAFAIIVPIYSIVGSVGR